MKSPIFVAILVVVLAIAAGPYIYYGSVAADMPDFADLYDKLDGGAGTDPQVWFQLARDAREGDNLPVAARALDKAAEAGLAPVRVGMEKTRILVASGDSAGALIELQNLHATGFTVVSVLTGDSVINTLAGNGDYDALIEKMSVAAYPCAHQEGFQDFDFWIGEWDVHLANGTPAGANIIKSVERGCAIAENWTSASGGTGMSINYFDKSTNEWVQIWNAEGGSQINMRGGLTEEGMLLVGEVTTIAPASTIPFRGLWTLLDDGRVRQFFETSNDGGETWQFSFEGFYSRTVNSLTDNRTAN
jgi:hypothetical protein